MEAHDRTFISRNEVDFASFYWQQWRVFVWLFVALAKQKELYIFLTQQSWNTSSTSTTSLAVMSNNETREFVPFCLCCRLFVHCIHADLHNLNRSCGEWICGVLGSVRIISTRNWLRGVVCWLGLWLVLNRPLSVYVCFRLLFITVHALKSDVWSCFTERTMTISEIPFHKKKSSRSGSLHSTPEAKLSSSSSTGIKIMFCSSHETKLHDLFQRQLLVYVVIKLEQEK